MPYIEFEFGQLSAEVKEKLIKTLTEVSAEITGIPKHLFLVSFRELPDDSIAVGGKTVRALKEDLGK